MAAARLATADQMTGASGGEYLLNVPHSMAIAEDVVDTSEEAVYQFVPRQNFQSGLVYSTSSGRPLGWRDISGAHADAYTPRVEIGGSSHGGHEPVQRVLGVELHSGLLEDTASRSEYQPGCGDPYPGNDQQRELLSFPEGEDDAVTILVRDRDSLQPQTFLGNNIIDFYIKFLERRLPSEERNRCYFFNSFFFTKLSGSSSTSSDIDRCEADYDQVRKWTREVNLFEKDYVFIPVLRSSHWSLIIICNLSSVASTPEKRKGSPCILHLDPVEGMHESCEGQVRRYLYRACKERYQGSIEKDDMLEALACNVKFVRAQVPRQDNSYDCGVHVLHYVEVFLRESTSSGFSIATSEEVAHFSSPHFAGEVSAKREAIRTLIDDLSGNPQEHAARVVDVQRKRQPNGGKACSPRPEPKRSCKPPKGPKKISDKWEKEETSVLLNRLEEGGRIRKGSEGATHWDLISQGIKTQCGTIRSGDECRRRYDTLLKAFKKVEKTGKAFCDITDKERLELCLATPISEEWYKAIGRICVQRSSESTKSGKRAKLNASDGTGMLSFSPPAPSIPCGRPQPERPTRKQVAVPGFRSMDDDLRSTLLNLIQASSVENWSNWREWSSWKWQILEDFSELEVTCQRLATVQDRKPSDIRSLVLQLSELKLVKIQLQWKEYIVDDEGSTSEWVPCLNLLKLRAYKKFLEKVLCKNAHLNTYLQMCDNDDSVSFPETLLPLSLQRIRVLVIWFRDALVHVDLSNFPELRLLDIIGCENLKAITGWEAVNRLGWLEIRECGSYADFPPVQCLPSLREFCVNQKGVFGNHSVLQKYWALDFSQCVRLRRLELSAPDGLPVLNIMGLSTLRFLEVLSIRYQNAPTTLEGLSGLHALTHLDFRWCTALRRVPELGCLKALTRLDMSGSGVEEIPGVQELHLLISLILRCCGSLTALPYLGHLKALAHLDLIDSSVEEIPGAQDLESLETLQCAGSRLKRLPDLHHLPRLREVRVRDTPLSKESDPSSLYYGKVVVFFDSIEERTLGFVDYISDVSDTE